MPFSPEGDPDELFESAEVEIPIDGTLDLHTFRPSEVRDLVPEYLEECRRRGILDVRIIHGKGTGTLRKLVHTILDRHPGILGYQTPTDASSWGATVVRLADRVPEGH